MSQKSQSNFKIISDTSSASSTQQRVELKLPTKDTPGYLRRQREALELSRKLQDPKERGAETIDAVVDFLLPFVSTPTDRNKAREGLFDLSENQFQQALDRITGTGDTTPLAKPASSEIS